MNSERFLVYDIDSDDSSLETDMVFLSKEDIEKGGEEQLKRHLEKLEFQYELGLQKIAGNFELLQKIAPLPEDYRRQLKSFSAFFANDSVNVTNKDIKTLRLRIYGFQSRLKEVFKLYQEIEDVVKGVFTDEKKESEEDENNIDVEGRRKPNRHA
ncbi:MAG: hypothetical protein WCX97_03715 [Candidatus Magasanikbacteria bacterium]